MANKKLNLVGAGTVTRGIPSFMNCDGERLSSSNSLPNSGEAVRSLSLTEILVSANAPSVIDYLSVDIEGSEDLALLRHDFDRYQFKCMTIERPSQELRQRLSKLGYIIIKEIPDLDCFYLSKEHVSCYCTALQKFYGSGSRLLSIYE